MKEGVGESVGVKLMEKGEEMDVILIVMAKGNSRAEHSAIEM